MLDLAHGTTITGAKFFQNVEVLWAEVEFVLDANLELLAIFIGTRIVWPASLRCGWGFGSSGSQGETFDILALHGSGGEAVRHGGQYRRNGYRVLFS
jgi:hypothetical protein